MQHDLEIILVEDDVELCEEFEKCFEETEGIELAATTDSAEQALEFVRRLQPDVVILDLELHMGEGNGITFLSKLRKLRGIQKPYVLVNTNNSSRITYDIVRNLGADFVMFKHMRNIDAVETFKHQYAHSSKVDKRILKFKKNFRYEYFQKF